jgi:hypothetical protein
MSETIDPLLFLREHLISQKSVQILDKQVDFSGQLRLPLDTQTAWQRVDKKGYYTLGSLFVCVQLGNLKYTDYFKKAHEMKIPPVITTERNSVLDYFAGKISECQQIDLQMRAQTLVKKYDKGQGRTGAQAQQRKRDSKAQEKEEQKLEVCDYLMLNEKKIHSRSTVIQSSKRSFLKVLQLGYQCVKLDE